MKRINSDIQISDIVEYGQGYDDAILEVFKAFRKFYDGYYELVNYGDDWWETLNQDVCFERVMEKEWANFTSLDMDSVLSNMKMALIGVYVRLDRFVDGLDDAFQKGNGLRHKPLDAPILTDEEIDNFGETE